MVKESNLLNLTVRNKKISKLPLISDIVISKRKRIGELNGYDWNL